MDSKKVVIVTGASRGIGRATALTFAEKGYNITLVGRDLQELTNVSRQINNSFNGNGETIICAGDLSDIDFVKSIVDQTIVKWDRIDILVNNAAWRTIQTMRTIDLDTWERTLRICITAPAFLSKWAAQTMEERNIGGVIVNISSIMHTRVPGYSPAYTATKGAIESLTKELAVTYGRSGIRVISIAPGNIDTSLGNDYKTESGDNVSKVLSDDMIGLTPLERAGSPQEIANAIFWVSSDQAAFVTGCTLVVDGGFMQNFNNFSFKKLQFPNEF